VDGYYVERHSGLAYWLWEPVTPVERSFNTFRGTASFWFKPNFDPAYTGKVRSIASISRYHRKNFYYRNPSPFTLYFMPAFTGTDGKSVTTSGDSQYTQEGGAPVAFDFKRVPLFDQQFGQYKAVTGIPRASMVFHIAYSTFDGIGWGAEDNWKPGVGQTKENSPFTPQWSEAEMMWITDSQNKKALGLKEDDFDGLRAHHWTHIAMTWKIADDVNWSTGVAGERLKVVVNGQDRAKGGSESAQQVLGSFSSSFSGIRNYAGSGKAADDRLPRISDTDFVDHVSGLDGSMMIDERWHFPGDRWEEPELDRFILNTFRLGEASTHSFAPETFTRNFSSDGTYDEFYFWKDTAPADMGQMSLASAANPNNLAAKKFSQGRYYVPKGTDDDALWTSPELTLKGPSATRELANATSTTSTPGIKADKAGVGMTTTEGSRVAIRLLGVSWTWYAEKYSSEIAGNTLGGQMGLVPVMVDYQNPSGPADLRQEKSSARLFVSVDNLKYPLNDPSGLSNDAYSPILDQAGQALSLGDAGKFRYHVKFVVEGSDISTVLLTSPVMDDVTFYYLTPGSAFLQYVERSEIE
jgi:hypothetical protein